MAGLYIIFSKRLTSDAEASGLAFLCCAGYTAAILLLGSMTTALVMPFLPLGMP
jgi:hypothetical protein